jgi:hypothetical protein
MLSDLFSHKWYQLSQLQITSKLITRDCFRALGWKAYSLHTTQIYLQYDFGWGISTTWVLDTILLNWSAWISSMCKVYILQFVTKLIIFHDTLHMSKWKYCHIYRVIIEGVWIGNWIHLTLWYSAWLQFTFHCYTHTHISVHVHVFTSRCLIAASTGGRFLFSAFPNCLRSQLPVFTATAHNNWTPVLIYFTH